MCFVIFAIIGLGTLHRGTVLLFWINRAFCYKIKSCTLVGSPHTSVESYRAFCNLQPGSWNYLVLCCVCECLLLVNCYCMEQSHSWEAQVFSLSRISSHIMEPKDSLTPSQVRAACHYPEPAWSSPYPHPTSWRSILILFSLLLLSIPSSLFLSVFPTKTLYTPLLPSPPYTPHAQLISFSSFSSENYWVRSTDH